MTKTVEETAAEIAGPHYECEDPFYCCPKTISDKRACECGFDKRLPKIIALVEKAQRLDALVIKLTAEPWGGSLESRQMRAENKQLREALQRKIDCRGCSGGAGCPPHTCAALAGEGGG